MKPINIEKKKKTSIAKIYMLKGKKKSAGDEY